MTEHLNHTTIADELGRGNTITFYTKGVSMKPLLKENQTHVTISPIRMAQKRDILLYIRQNGALVLHRLMKQDDAFYYMRGDNTYGLEKIRKEQAIGIVTHIYRKGKQFSVTRRGYRFYVRIWNLIYPCRYLCYKIKRMIKKVFGKGDNP